MFIFTLLISIVILWKKGHYYQELNDHLYLQTFQWPSTLATKIG